MPTNLGPAEILVILVVALIVLGPNRLPEAGRQVGRALAEVRRWSRGIQSEIRDVLDTDAEPPRVSSDPVSESTAEPVTSGPSARPERPADATEGMTPPNGSAAASDEPPRH